jgi:hypothetical protein
MEPKIGDHVVVRADWEHGDSSYTACVVEFGLDGKIVVLDDSGARCRVYAARLVPDKRYSTRGGSDA